MPINIRQDGDGSAGLVGRDGGNGEFITVNIEYTPTTIPKISFVATRSYVIKSIMGRVDVAGTDAGAVNANVLTTLNGSNIAAGASAHTGTFNLKGTASTNQLLNVVAPSPIVAAGTAIGITFSGVMTSATGTVSVCLVPL